MDHGELPPSGADMHAQRGGRDQTCGLEAEDYWAELADLHRRIDSLFHRMYGLSGGDTDADATIESMHGRSGETRNGASEPEIEIYETDQEFVIHAALPGVVPGDIGLEVTEHTVALRAENRVSARRPADGIDVSNGVTSHRKSRFSRHSRFSFGYRLPAPIDVERVNAVLDHGMLTIRLAKRIVERKIARQVEITVGTQAVGTREASSLRPNSSSISNQDRAHTSRAAAGVVEVDVEEGNPSRKMGAVYTPGTAEDHTSISQAAGVRQEHPETRAKPTVPPVISAEPTASGSTNTLPSP